MTRLNIVLACLSVLLLSAILHLYEGVEKRPPAPRALRSLRVTATAYTSQRRQTDSTPYLAAWSNRLVPGVKSIAISRDLLELGIGNGTALKIGGLPGTYTVLDKMNKRWQRRIDIYMGNDLKRAKAWGSKEVIIYW